MATDPEQVFQDRFWVTRCLDGEAQHCIVESLIRIVIKIIVGVTLDDGQSAGNASVDFAAADLDATAINGTRVLQELQQGAIATTNVEHAGANRDHLCNQLVVRAIGLTRDWVMCDGESA